MVEAADVVLEVSLALAVCLASMPNTGHVSSPCSAISRAKCSAGVPPTMSLMCIELSSQEGAGRPSVH